MLPVESAYIMSYIINHLIAKSDELYYLGYGNTWTVSLAKAFVQPFRKIVQRQSENNESPGIMKQSFSRIILSLKIFSSSVLSSHRILKFVLRQWLKMRNRVKIECSAWANTFWQIPPSVVFTMHKITWDFHEILYRGQEFCSLLFDEMQSITYGRLLSMSTYSMIMTKSQRIEFNHWTQIS